MCRLCESRFPNWAVVHGQRRSLSHRKYCLDCSAWGGHNTRQLEQPPPTHDPSRWLRCSRCKQVKPLEEFYRRRDGRRPRSWCKACNLEQRKRRSHEDRYAALLHYSGGDIRCACCGERTMEFLGLDHVNNDGAAHRLALFNRRSGSGMFYTWLRTSGYTYAHLVVACHNCNMARGLYGRCPHQAL